MSLRRLVKTMAIVRAIGEAISITFPVEDMEMLWSVHFI